MSTAQRPLLLAFKRERCVHGDCAAGGFDTLPLSMSLFDTPVQLVNACVNDSYALCVPTQGVPSHCSIGLCVPSPCVFQCFGFHRPVCSNALHSITQCTIILYHSPSLCFLVFRNRWFGWHRLDCRSFVPFEIQTELG